MNQEIKYSNTLSQNTANDESDGKGSHGIHNEISSHNYLLADIYQDDIFNDTISPDEKTTENYLLWDVYQDDIISRLNKCSGKSDQYGTCIAQIMKAFLIACSMRKKSGETICR